MCLGQRDFWRRFFCARFEPHFVGPAFGLLDGRSRLGADLSDHHLGVCIIGQSMGTNDAKDMTSRKPKLNFRKRWLTK